MIKKKTKKKVKPLNSYVLVEVIKSEAGDIATKHGIVTDVGGTEEATEKAVVLHTGGSKIVKKGDVIFAKKYLIDTIEEHSFIKEDAILGKEE